MFPLAHYLVPWNEDRALSMGLTVLDLSQVAGFRYDNVTHPRRQYDDEFGLNLDSCDFIPDTVKWRCDDHFNIYASKLFSNRFSIIQHLY